MLGLFSSIWLPSCCSESCSFIAKIWFPLAETAVAAPHPGKLTYSKMHYTQSRFIFHLWHKRAHWWIYVISASLLFIHKWLAVQNEMIKMYYIKSLCRWSSPIPCVCYNSCSSKRTSRVSFDIFFFLYWICKYSSQIVIPADHISHSPFLPVAIIHLQFYSVV